MDWIWNEIVNKILAKLDESKNGDNGPSVVVWLSSKWTTDVATFIGTWMNASMICPDMLVRFFLVIMTTLINVFDGFRKDI